MEKIVDYDVMIVGGGPSGISTWIHLNKYASNIALNTVLLEKEKYPREKLCGGAVSSWGQDILKMFDINIDAPCVEINNTKYQFEKEIFCKKEPGFLKIFRRHEFDYELAKAAMKKGLKIHQQESIQEISYNTQGLQVKTNKKKYIVKILVGADGAFSTVRRLMNSKNKPHYAMGIELFAPANQRFDSEFYEKTALLDFTPINEGFQGYIWHFPCLKDSEPFMNHGVYNSRIIVNKTKMNIRKILTRQLQSRNLNDDLVKWSAHPIPILNNNIPIAQPNIFLVGDAAGIEPLLGGGIHLALSYGDIAASTILNAIHSNNFTFDTYNKELQNHLVGKYIKKCTYLAYEVYNRKLHIIDAIKKIFKI